MVYEVSLSIPAEDDTYAAFAYIRESSPDHAEAWLNLIFARIQSLERMPTRCSIISEAGELGFQARHLLFGTGRGAYRIIFRIDEGKREVHVLRIWHASRAAIGREDANL